LPSPDGGWNGWKDGVPPGGWGAGGAGGAMAVILMREDVTVEAVAQE
jgi:hypothetical protein